jgi:hypothetical protein
MPAASAAPTEGSQVPHFCHPLAEVGSLTLLAIPPKPHLLELQPPPAGRDFPGTPAQILCFNSEIERRIGAY